MDIDRSIFYLEQLRNFHLEKKQRYGYVTECLTLTNTLLNFMDEVVVSTEDISMEKVFNFGKKLNEMIPLNIKIIEEKKDNIQDSN